MASEKKKNEKEYINPHPIHPDIEAGKGLPEGDFCPECGAPWPDLSKKNCWHCGF